MSEPKAPDLTGRPRMTWAQAVEAMKRGEFVRMASQCFINVLQPADDDDPDAAIYESGQEGIYFAYAWTEDEKPVRVFMGASSKCPFVPTDELCNATDWVVVTKEEA